MRKKTSIEAKPTKEAEKKVKTTTKSAATNKTVSAKKAGAAFHEKIMVQYGANEYDSLDIAERCKAAYKADHKVGIHSCTIYIKPEDGMAYYVINKVSGKIEL